jgi:hypothetical protein
MPQSLDAFLPHLQPWLIAAPEPISRAALIRAAREFCEQTHVIQANIGPLNSTAGQPDFTLTPPTDQEVVRVKRAWWLTTPLGLASQDDIDTPLAFFPTVGSTTRTNGTPSEAYLTAPGVLTLAPPPDQTVTNAVTVRVVLRPTLAATTLADELYSDWLDAIVCRAVLFMAAMPGTTFTDAPSASAAQALYEAEMKRAADVARRGRYQTALRVRGVPFA